ncbi:DUF4190 domain-containing protein [Gordonia otitidis]|uniref:DUF4190 domain-containing protein n=1 Tax=Gordonia otitidis TaxID=249058 RepID=UPI001D1464CD|nr:DUF4190 domain-containing protein [Gordonia otitidis]UEA58100.1 DUF4190 domain-containing protein [Gordonia otitidis]
MRTEHPTAPIEPTLTDRYQRWPSSNDLDSMSLPCPPGAGTEPDDTARSTPRTRSRAHRVPVTGLRDTSRDAPIPEVGDYWDVAHGDRVRYDPVALTPSRVAPIRLLPHNTRPAPLATASLVTALAALPLIPVLGIGGVAGVLSIALGAAGVRQINRQQGRYHGSARAITGIVFGTIATLIGMPILLLVLLVAGV